YRHLACRFPRIRRGDKETGRQGDRSNIDFSRLPVSRSPGLLVSGGAAYRPRVRGAAPDGQGGVERRDRSDAGDRGRYSQSSSEQYFQQARRDQPHPGDRQSARAAPPLGTWRLLGEPKTENLVLWFSVLSSRVTPLPHKITPPFCL